MGWLLPSHFISSPCFHPLVLKELLHLMLKTDDTAPVLSWQHYSALLGKTSCHPIKVSSKAPFNQPIIPPQVAFHRHGQTARFHQTHLCISVTEIQMHEQRGCLWLSTPSLAQPGLGTDWIAENCTGVGKMNILGSYVQVFNASKQKYIGGIILTKHSTPESGWDFHKS